RDFPEGTSGYRRAQAAVADRARTRGKATTATKGRASGRDAGGASGRAGAGQAGAVTAPRRT
ncbi:MAG: hypothetical protein ACYCTI_08060, partial [Acidimicrobiales bacterium]